MKKPHKDRASNFFVAVLFAATALPATSRGQAPVAPGGDCAPAPAGLVSWWRGENNASDSIGANQGSPVSGLAYTNGEVDQAFSFNGSSSYVRVSNDPSLNPTGSFSIELWMNLRQDASSQQILVGKWGDNGELSNQRSYAFTVQPGRALGFSISDYAHQWDRPFHTFFTDPGIIALGTWNHVAAVYDQSAGSRRIFVNGVQVKTRTDAPITVLNGTAPVTFGVWYRAASWLEGYFRGSLDEISFYNRALSAAEIQGIYAAGSAGKCHEPPVILTQPLSQKVTVGLNATFSVVASGTPPLHYQWRFNGADLAGSTTSALAIAVSDAAGGLYSVLVTNAFGSAASSNAVLTVNHPPVADASATLSLRISSNDTNATAVLDGSRSSDPDGDALQYLWLVAGGADPLATGVVAVVTLPLGTNELTLSVNDGLAASSQPFAMEVITPAQAAERLVALAQSGATRSHPLVATLSAALAGIDRTRPTAAINQLQAFQNQVRAQVSTLDPELADSFIQAAQEIIDALAAGQLHGKITFVSRETGGKTRLKGDAAPGALYIVEASTNLLDWEMIGVTTNNGAGTFEFEDTSSSPLSVRFYRVVSPYARNSFCRAATALALFEVVAPTNQETAVGICLLLPGRAPLILPWPRSSSAQLKPSSIAWSVNSPNDSAQPHVVRGESFVTE